MKILCERCKCNKEPILKMGGLVCRKCGVIMKAPGIDPEYYEYVEKKRQECKNKPLKNTTDT